MAKKKPTIKEIEAKVEMLTRVNNTVVEMVDNLGTIFKNYIDFKGDTQDFADYTEEQRKIREKIMGEANEHIL